MKKLNVYKMSSNTVRIVKCKKMQATTINCLRWLEHEGKRMHTELLCGNLLENVTMVYRGGDGRITLRWIFRRQVVRMGGGL
jgi:hypothetical protein